MMLIPPHLLHVLGTLVEKAAEVAGAALVTEVTKDAYKAVKEQRREQSTYDVIILRP